MNKTVLYIIAALVGVGAAVGLFGLAGPSDEAASGTPVADVGDDVKPKDRKQGKRKKPVKKDQKAANPNPFAAEAQKNLASDWGQYCLEAAPAWTNIGMEVGKDGHTEVAADARKEAGRLRKERRKSDVDSTTILAEERALLERVDALDPNEAAAGSVVKIRALMASLEAAEAAAPEEVVEEPAE
jgi:hypothetical protein